MATSAQPVTGIPLKWYFHSNVSFVIWPLLSHSKMCILVNVRKQHVHFYREKHHHTVFICVISEILSLRLPGYQLLSLCTFIPNIYFRILTPCRIYSLVNKNILQSESLFWAMCGHLSSLNGGHSNCVLCLRGIELNGCNEISWSPFVGGLKCTCTAHVVGIHKRITECQHLGVTADTRLPYCRVKLSKPEVITSLQKVFQNALRSVELIDPPVGWCNCPRSSLPFL